MWHEAERQALAQTLLEVGPDAPTLCEGWQTRHLAAHLALREHAPWVMAAGALAPSRAWSERRMAEQAAAFEGSVATFARPPRRFSPRQVAGDSINLLEFFVHHEDVRRALGREPRELSPALVNALWHRTRQMVPLLLLRSPVRVVHVLPDGRRAALGRGPRTVVLRAAAPELALHAFGRGANAQLVAEGSAEDVAALDQVLPLPG